RIGSEDRLEFRIVDRAADADRNLLPALAADHRRVNALLLIDLFLLLFRRHRRLVEDAPLLREDDLVAGRSRRGEETDRVNALVLGGGVQRHGAAFAVADGGDVLRVDVFARRQVPDSRARVLRVLVQPRRLRSSAALTNAALVVAHDDEPRI